MFGAAHARWLPVTGCLAVTTTGVIYFWVAWRLLRRRASHHAQTGLAWGIRHTQPIWMRLSGPLLALGVGASIAAIPAAIGLPAVALGVLLIFGIVAAGLLFATFGPQGLTLEDAGLRFDIRGGSFNVSWANVASVECIGAGHSQVIQLRVHDTDAIIDSSEPPDPDVQSRVASCLVRRKDGEGFLMLLPWTAGVDGASLARAIDQAMDGKPQLRAVN